MDAARWLLILILALVYPDSYSAWQGKVVDIVRADEVKVARWGVKFAGTVNVRLYGVDSPLVVRRQPYGKEAKAYATRRLMGRVVKVQPLPGLVKGLWYRPKKFVPHDDLHWDGNIHTRYDRVIALVYVDGVNISEEYLTNGIAWWYKPFVPFERGYKHLQDEARKARKGLWALPDPIPPWKWQKTPISRVNPWQRKQWTLFAYAALGVLIFIVLVMLLVTFTKRCIGLVRSRSQKKNRAALRM